MPEGVTAKAPYVETMLCVARGYLDEQDRWNLEGIFDTITVTNLPDEHRFFFFAQIQIFPEGEHFVGLRLLAPDGRAMGENNHPAESDSGLLTAFFDVDPLRMEVSGAFRVELLLDGKALAAKELYVVRKEK